MKAKNDAIELRDEPGIYRTEAPSKSAMVRTQIYLTEGEHQFLGVEARRTGKPMAELIRGYIDEKMHVPDDAWAAFLKPGPVDPTWEGHEDGGINHDHYVSGTPKRYIKKGGKWVKGPDTIDE